MAITISSAFIEEYSALVRQLAQQRTTRLRPTVSEVASSGEAYNWDRLAATDATEKTTRRADTPYIDDTWTRRVAVPSTFNHAMTIEHEDKVQMLVDPQSAYAENQAMSMDRSEDDIIIGAATGDVLGGDGTPVAFPAEQVVGDGSG